MTLPKWNSEWDESDPLKGRQGWALHHYIERGVVVLLLAIVVGLVAPPVLRTRVAATKLKRAWEMKLASEREAREADFDAPLVTP